METPNLGSGLDHLIVAHIFTTPLRFKLNLDQIDSIYRPQLEPHFILVSLSTDCNSRLYASDTGQIYKMVGVALNVRHFCQNDIGFRATQLTTLLIKRWGRPLTSKVQKDGWERRQVIVSLF